MCCGCSCKSLTKVLFGFKRLCGYNVLSEHVFCVVCVISHTMPCLCVCSFYMKQKKTLEINPGHPLIKELLRRVQNEKAVDQTTKDLARVMYESALLRSGFALQDSTGFATRIERMLRLSLGVDVDAPVSVLCGRRERGGTTYACIDYRHTRTHTSTTHIHTHTHACTYTHHTHTHARTHIYCTHIHTCALYDETVRHITSIKAHSLMRSPLMRLIFALHRMACHASTVPHRLARSLALMREMTRMGRRKSQIYPMTQCKQSLWYVC